MKEMNKKLIKLVDLDRKIEKLPTLSPVEKRSLETEQRFQATYYSNKLEGNKLSEKEARNAVLINLIK